ncbi:F-box domain containing protein [Tanacetum coccineum]
MSLRKVARDSPPPQIRPHNPPPPPLPHNPPSQPLTTAPTTTPHLWREAAESKPSRRAAESSREAAESTSSRVHKQPSQHANEELYPGCDKVVDILCDLELIYPPALFNIMVHLVIHLPLEALEGGLIHPRWMFPFERYMKKLKGYVRNKAKPKGLIVEGYVAEEALTFSSHYFQDVTTKFNHLDRNVDPLPQCVGFRCFDRPEIDTYRSHFKSLFPNKDMQEEFPDWTSNSTCKKLQMPQQAFFQGQTLEGRPPDRDLRCGGDQAGTSRGDYSGEWDKYIKFWNDPKNLARAAQNQLNRQKSAVISRQGSRSLARLRDEMRQSLDTQEYPSLIDTFWRTHTVDGEEMKRLEATGEYTEDDINRLARRGKLRRHIPGVGRVLPARATSRPSMPAPDKLLKSIHKRVNFMMSLFRSDSKYSDMFKEFESGGTSGSDGCSDDEESGDDEEGKD